MTDWTPGPWELFIDDTGGEWSGWPLCIDAVEIEDKTIVRTGGMWPYKWDAKTSQHEAVSNARLIAAAPDLYAALKSICWRLEYGHVDGAKDVARTDGVAALAKAGGEPE